MKESINYSIVTAADNIEIINQAREKIHLAWPEFMLHDPVADLLSNCYDEFPQFQFVLLNKDTGESMALGNSIPLDWQGKYEDLPNDGWDWALQKGIEENRKKCQPTILCALQIVVFGDYRNLGLSRIAVKTMKEIGQQHNLAGMIAPVRPNLKHQYPLTPIEKYIKWENDRGLPFDPWLRVHVSVGAKIVKPCLTAMRITGRVAEWEDWTSLHFPETGEYIVPGALVPVIINCENDLGTYIEPNVWVIHPEE